MLGSDHTADAGGAERSVMDQARHVQRDFLRRLLLAQVEPVLQTALLNWIGFPAMALLVLLLFFSMPLLNVAPEFMPQATQDWLYSWTPFRYAASGVRNLMYFGGEHGMSLPYGVMWGIAGGGLAAILASALRQPRPAASHAAPAPAPAER